MSIKNYINKLQFIKEKNLTHLYDVYADEKYHKYIDALCEITGFKNYSYGDDKLSLLLSLLNINDTNTLDTYFNTYLTSHKPLVAENYEKYKPINEDSNAEATNLFNDCFETGDQSKFEYYGLGTFLNDDNTDYTQSLIKVLQHKYSLNITSLDCSKLFKVRRHINLEKYYSKISDKYDDVFDKYVTYCGNVISKLCDVNNMANDMETILIRFNEFNKKLLKKIFINEYQTSNGETALKKLYTIANCIDILDDKNNKKTTNYTLHYFVVEELINSEFNNELTNYTKIKNDMLARFPKNEEKIKSLFEGEKEQSDLINIYEEIEESKSLDDCTQNILDTLLNDEKLSEYKKNINKDVMDIISIIIKALNVNIDVNGLYKLNLRTENKYNITLAYYHIIVLICMHSSTPSSNVKSYVKLCAKLARMHGSEYIYNNGNQDIKQLSNIRNIMRIVSTYITGEYMKNPLFNGMIDYKQNIPDDKLRNDIGEIILHCMYNKIPNDEQRDTCIKVLNGTTWLSNYAYYINNTLSEVAALILQGLKMGTVGDNGVYTHQYTKLSEWENIIGKEKVDKIKANKNLYTYIKGLYDRFVDTKLQKGGSKYDDYKVLYARVMGSLENETHQVGGTTDVNVQRLQSATDYGKIYDGIIKYLLTLNKTVDPKHDAMIRKYIKRIEEYQMALNQLFGEFMAGNKFSLQKIKPYEDMLKMEKDEIKINRIIEMVQEKINNDATLKHIALKADNATAKVTEAIIALQRRLIDKMNEDEFKEYIREALYNMRLMNNSATPATIDNIDKNTNDKAYTTDDIKSLITQIYTAVIQEKKYKEPQLKEWTQLLPRLNTELDKKNYDTRTYYNNFLNFVNTELRQPKGVVGPILANTKRNLLQQIDLRRLSSSDPEYDNMISHFTMNLPV